MNQGVKQEWGSGLYQMNEEIERMEYLVRHFNDIIPVIKAVEEVKGKIKLNGVSSI